MSTLSDPKLILAQAAEAAAAASNILPKLERELDEMEAAIQVKRQEINEVRQLAERHKAQPNVRVMTVAEAAAARTATPDIELALREAGPISVPDMVAWISAKTTREWGSSTLYNQLKKGKDLGRYINVDNKWSIAPAGHDIFGGGPT